MGRAGIAAYYDGQPRGLTAAYRLLETRRLADDVILGYADARFGFTDREPLDVALAVVARREDGDWRLAHYQVSRVTGCRRPVG